MMEKKLKKLADKMHSLRKGHDMYFDSCYGGCGGIIGCKTCEKLKIHEPGFCCPPWNMEEAKREHEERMARDLWEEFRKIIFNA